MCLSHYYYIYTRLQRFRYYSIHRYYYYYVIHTLLTLLQKQQKRTTQKTQMHVINYVTLHTIINVDTHPLEHTFNPVLFSCHYFYYVTSTLLTTLHKQQPRKWAKDIESNVHK